MKTTILVNFFEWNSVSMSIYNPYIILLTSKVKQWLSYIIPLTLYETCPKSHPAHPGRKVRGSQRPVVSSLNASLREAPVIRVEKHMAAMTRRQ